MSCYSNIQKYGAQGLCNPIVPPAVVTEQPWMFNIIKPHSYPNKKVVVGNYNCVPYEVYDMTQNPNEQCQ